MLEQLPPLVLESLVWQLSKREQLVVRSLSKGLNGCSVQTLFHRLSLNELDLNKLSSLLKYASLVRNLTVVNIPFKPEFIAREFCNLSCLNLKNVVLEEGEGGAVGWEGFGSLVSLTLQVDGRIHLEKENSVYVPKIQSLTGLKRLYLVEFDLVSAQKLFYTLTQLVTFHLVTFGPEVPKKFNPKSLRQLTTNFSHQFKQSYRQANLKELFLSNNVDVGVDQDFVLVGKDNFANLNQLTLGLSLGRLEHQFVGLAGVKLRFLYLNYPSFTLHHLNSIVNGLVGLQSLHVMKIGFLPLEELNFNWLFSNLTQLGNLSLDLSTYLYLQPSLDSLNVNFQLKGLALKFPGLTLQWLQMINLKFPNLHSLELLGAIDHSYRLALQLKQLPPSFQFNWKVLIIPDFNLVSLELIKLCRNLKVVKYRFRVHEILEDKVKSILQFSHPDLVYLFKYKFDHVSI